MSFFHSRTPFLFFGENLDKGEKEGLSRVRRRKRFEGVYGFDKFQSLRQFYGFSGNFEGGFRDFCGGNKDHAISMLL